MPYTRQNINNWKKSHRNQGEGGDSSEAKPKSKYHAKKIELDGITFDSKKEAKRYDELKALEKLKVIFNLRLQVPYVLIEKSQYGRCIKYYADFVYLKDGEVVVEDCKGMRTPVYRLKKRLMAEKYGIIILET